MAIPETSAEVGFLSLPDELIVEIFKLCSRDDRVQLKQVNRRFFHIYKYRISPEFVFHLQGYAHKRFDQGFHFLMNISSARHVQDLKLSKFDLRATFDLRHPDDGSFLGMPLDSYKETSYACKNITSIEIDGCVVTDRSLVMLRRLFPELKYLSMARCSFLKSGQDFISTSSLQLSPMRELHLTLPVVSNARNHPSIFGWLIDCCVKLDKLNFHETESRTWLRPPFIKRHPTSARFLKQIGDPGMWLSPRFDGPRLEGVLKKYYLDTHREIGRDFNSRRSQIKSCYIDTLPMSFDFSDRGLIMIDGAIVIGALDL